MKVIARRLFNTSEYSRMRESGILVEDDRVEMIGGEKMPRYAEAGIAEGWLVDVASRVIEQYTLPRNGRYLNLRRLEHGDVIASPALPMIELPVDEILGRVN